jgi:ribose 5-phosphate isomerase B
VSQSEPAATDGGCLGIERETVKVAVANDHAGYPLKVAVVSHLQALGHQVDDLGSYGLEPVDYPPYCAACARHVVGGLADTGIVIGGSGQGEQMAANKVHGARAALCHDEYTARLARQHNNANVLSLGARILANELAFDIVDVFLATAFEGGRHQARLDELGAIEAEESRVWAVSQDAGPS